MDSERDPRGRRVGLGALVGRDVPGRVGLSPVALRGSERPRRTARTMSRSITRRGTTFGDSAADRPRDLMAERKPPWQVSRRDVSITRGWSYRRVDREADTYVRESGLLMTKVDLDPSVALTLNEFLLQIRAAKALEETKPKQ